MLLWLGERDRPGGGAPGAGQLRRIHGAGAVPPDQRVLHRERGGPGPAGAEGDFLTAPTAAPLFAATLARLLKKLAEAVGSPLTLVELGAGEGTLLDRLGTCLGEARCEVLGRAVAVESAPWARRRIGERCDWVEVTEKLFALSAPGGPVVLFASEFYDALPCRRVTLLRKGEAPGAGRALRGGGRRGAAAVGAGRAGGRRC